MSKWLVGFLVLDYWIVDASITHEYLVPWLAFLLWGWVGWGMVYECVTFVVLYIVLCLDHFIARTSGGHVLLCVLVVCVASW